MLSVIEIEQLEVEADQTATDELMFEAIESPEGGQHTKYIFGQ